MEFCEILQKIKKDESCAVHVRRGDLSRYNPFYGNPPTADSFIKAMKYITSKKPNTVFYFFSDEMFRTCFEEEILYISERKSNEIIAPIKESIRMCWI